MGQSAKWFFKNKEWYLIGQHGHEIIRTNGAGFRIVGGSGTLQNVGVGTLATLQSLKLGGGSTLGAAYKLTGTCAGIAAIGSGAIAVGTITGMTGVAVGDAVMGAPKADVSAGHVGIGGFFVPTTNVVNVWLQNSKPDSAGSFPATGFDIFAVR